MTHHAGKGGVYPVGTEWMGRYRPLVAALVKHTNVVQRAAGRTVRLSEEVSLSTQEWQVFEYILEKASEALQGTSSLLFTACSYVVYLLLSVLIPSSSGLATVSMPIMGPLAQNLGLVPEIMVCVLSGACALVNGITPTSGTLMGAIAISRIEYTTWVKYIWKPLAAMLVLHILILSVGMAVL